MRTISLSRWSTMAFVALCAACGGRSGFAGGDEAVTLLSVSTPLPAVTPGARAVLVQLTVVNRTRSLAHLLRADLLLPPEAGFSQRHDLQVSLPKMEPGESVVVNTFLDVPAQPPAQAVIDGMIWAASLEEDRLLVDHGADHKLTLVLDAHDDWPSSDRDLVVSVRTDEQDGADTMSTVEEAGGAAHLSLREAMLIANNRPGPDRILFSPAVFPPVSLQTILLGAGHGEHLPELLDNDTEITAFDPGGVQLGVQLAPAAEYQYQYVGTISSRGAGTVVRGLRFQDFALAIRITAGSATVEGNRIDCLGTDLYGHGIDVSGTGIRLLDNQVERCGSAFILTNCTDSVMTGNRVYSSNYLATNLSALSVDRMIIADNVFRSGRYGVRLSGNGNVLSGNHVEAHTLGVVVFAGSADNQVLDNTIALTSYGNVCEPLTCGMGVGVEGAARTSIRRNSITRSTYQGIGLAAGGNEGVTSPVITAADVSSVSGTSTAVNGSIIEIFSDPDDEGEQYLGQTTVSGGVWSYLGNVPAGRNVTATVTTPTGNTSAFSSPVAIP